MKTKHITALAILCLAPTLSNVHGVEANALQKHIVQTVDDKSTATISEAEANKC
jgi:hypothetical protein